MQWSLSSNLLLLLSGGGLCSIPTMCCFISSSLPLSPVVNAAVHHYTKCLTWPQVSAFMAHALDVCMWPCKGPQQLCWCRCECVTWTALVGRQNTNCLALSLDWLAEGSWVIPMPFLCLRTQDGGSHGWGSHGWELAPQSCLPQTIPDDQCGICTK